MAKMQKFEERNDLRFTSTGIGHEFRAPDLFPPLDFKRSVVNPLPQFLSNGDRVKDFYMTATGSSHDFKGMPPDLLSNLYKKAPGHWGVNYIEETVKKIQVKPQLRPLTMANQESEMKAQFKGSEGISLKTRFSSDVQPPMYRSRHNQEQKPAGSGLQTSCLPGQQYRKLHERGVFDFHGDMYLTTTQKTHRPFAKNELRKYPKKEYATYWECEGYPKSWGHGSKSNPLPPDVVPHEKGVMQDSIWFKEATTIPRLPKPLQRVPHTGMCTEVDANYCDIDAQKRKELFYCPVSRPWELTSPGKDEIFTVPKMYRTEYQSISSGKPVLV